MTASFTMVAAAPALAVASGACEERSMRSATLAASYVLK